MHLTRVGFDTDDAFTVSRESDHAIDDELIILHQGSLTMKRRRRSRRAGIALVLCENSPVAGEQRRRGDVPLRPQRRENFGRGGCVIERERSCAVGADHLGHNPQIGHDVAAQHEIGKNKIGSERQDQGGSDGRYDDQNQLALDGQISITADRSHAIFV